MCEVCGTPKPGVALPVYGAEGLDDGEDDDGSYEGEDDDGGEYPGGQIPILPPAKPITEADIERIVAMGFTREQSQRCVSCCALCRSDLDIISLYTNCIRLSEPLCGA